MVKGYVFISTEIGKVKKVIKDLNNIDEVIEVDAVTGPYDVIVKLECEKLSDLTKDLIDNIHSIEGVIDTTTSLAVELKD